jgi:hypothetical protein
MPRHRYASTLTAVALALTTCGATASTLFPTGEYTRIEDSNYGSLTITSTSQASFAFRLLALTQFPGDPDGFYTRNGEIADSRAFIRGTSATYRSAYEEDKELGTCILTFRKSGNVITVTESGKCWWFGVGVNASGKYRASKGTAIPVRR